MKKQSLIIALLGMLIGAGIVLCANAFNSRPRTLPAGYAGWRKLNLILQCVSENYVDSVDHAKVTDAAVEAALKQLDPHTLYMPPRELEASEEDLSGNFSGIGIQFNVPNDTAIVIEVIPGGPAEKIGMLAGDRLMKVDSVNIAGCKYPQDSMVRRMKGPTGTKVTVTVKRDSELIPFEITRSKITTHSVDAAFMVNDTTGYIRLSKFARTTYAEFSTNCLELLAHGMKELVVDLKDNSGGYFDQALAICDLFLPKGAGIVYTEGIHRKREEYKATGNGLLKDIALKVLIDDGSASSSEIFAGAIQDNDRGLIYGRRSFGKGLVQEPFNFTDGSGVRITVARFYTPSGRCIQKPYADDYAYDVYKRYADGEMTSADSIKVDRSVEYHTVGGRTVYGGGGIIPDVFVPVDTTRVSKFYIACNKKATPMRFASAYFDAHKAELQNIEDYDALVSYLNNSSLESRFLEFARTKDGLVPESEWKQERQYMMTQVKALVGRYSKLSDKAFYHIYLSIDDVFNAAMAN